MQTEVGGITIDLSSMNRILQINGQCATPFQSYVDLCANNFPPEQDGDVVCQPGAKWVDINNTLKEKGDRKVADTATNFD